MYLNLQELYMFLLLTIPQTIDPESAIFYNQRLKLLQDVETSQVGKIDELCIVAAR